ncbi:D-alanyl-D-alanine carboxypeptidase family protein [Bacillus tianshenii]|uniref:D-alanyl-D-alanine carboxypeptidase family protein n=1 Tax=Sutcliffiella tianshenii TaxID=1463404 RepID=UPI001CD51E47|nr:D-alanyl-D-alanine carboxypeptidase family protein [Bacillus tianshenii]MCA1320260.1 D-alanyl-D-alanine carboxypeptidase family protein [Bacillus tianshenii]
MRFCYFIVILCIFTFSQLATPVSANLIGTVGPEEELAETTEQIEPEEPVDEGDDIPTGWVTEDGERYFYNENGELALGWFEVEGQHYYSDENGVVQVGWLHLDGSTYFLHEDGPRHSGWLEHEANWHYFNHHGVMQIGWANVDGSHYFFNDGGVMQKGWLDHNGSWYLLQNSGRMQTGWAYTGGSWYFLDGNGVMQTGWVQDGGKWYFIKQNGRMQAGWLWDNGAWYLLNSQGIMQTGWVKDHGKWYYFSSKGAMQRGWVKTNNAWYHLNSSGIMQTGWLKGNNSWYYLQPDGMMATGWFKDARNKWYYSYSSGKMATNAYIGGEYVSYSGVWIQRTTSFYYINGILLVNKFHALPSDYAPGESATARSAFNSMKGAAKSAGLEIVATSTYRSYSTQRSLYDNYVKVYGKAKADTFSALPGHSEHQTGLAFDIGGKDSSHWAEDSFAYTAEGKWLARNAHHYGFIVRYPKGKEHITGYQYEPWHFRYVGVTNATNIFNSGLSLEEYLGEY